MTIRRATQNDISGVVRIYEKILILEAEGKAHTGWQKGIYPTEKTAQEALEKNELYVFEDNGRVVASAKINQDQLPEYEKCRWAYEAPPSDVMVIHTLVVDPDESGCGIGSRFMGFYEAFALDNGCRYLRMDTNAINEKARALYKKLGFNEQGIVACEFNGLEGVQLVCLEKKLG